LFWDSNKGEKVEAVEKFVRNCQTKTMPRVEKKDLLKYRPLGCLPQDQGAIAWLEWVVGFIGGARL
jgi:hypothetical protein